MAIELERTIADGIERIIATADSGDEATLQQFTEEQNTLGFDIGPGLAMLNGGILQRTYTRPATPEAEAAFAEAQAVVAAEAESEEVDPGMDITDGALALAEENGIDLDGIVGTGSGGRIIVKDVRALVAAAAEDSD